MGAPERVALSRELVAETALAITDNEGLGGLSMRKLGSALGVEAMSIYHYVDNKNDLLAAVVDNLYGEIELPTDVPDHDWETAIGTALRSFYGVLLRHPAALELFTTHPSSGDNGMAVMGWAYDRCRLVGLGPDEASQTFHLCVAFVIGHAATELGMMAQLAAVVSPPPTPTLWPPISPGSSTAISPTMVGSCSRWASTCSSPRWPTRSAWNAPKAPQPPRFLGDVEPRSCVKLTS